MVAFVIAGFYPIITLIFTWMAKVIAQPPEQILNSLSMSTAGRTCLTAPLVQPNIHIGHKSH